jgi:hypothetical protein
VGTSSDIVDATPSSRRGFARLVELPWQRSVALACAFFLVLGTLIFGVHATLEEGTTGAGISDAHWRTDIVLALVAAYTVGAGLINIAASTRHFARLRPLYRHGEREFLAVRDRLFPTPRALALAASIGGLVGLALQLSAYLRPDHRPIDFQLHSLPLMILLFSLLGLVALFTTRLSRVFMELGREQIDIDLLDARSLSPFASIGLMTAATWFLGSALASFLMVSESDETVVALVIVVTTGLGIAGLILPSRGLHGHLKARKLAELARVREAIAHEREALFEPTATASPPPRMHAMLAYESRIESVREWPFDTSTLSRFGFFLLIPLVSWIGGALVERMIDAALG